MKLSTLTSTVASSIWMKEDDGFRYNEWALKMHPETKQALMEYQCVPLSYIYLLKLRLTVFHFSNRIRKCCFNSTFVAMNYSSLTEEVKSTTGAEQEAALFLFD